MSKKNGRKKRKPGNPNGRPISPDSLRQIGRELRVRVPSVDLDRYSQLAGEPGLSIVVRRLLEDWSRA